MSIGALIANSNEAIEMMAATQESLEFANFYPLLFYIHCAAFLFLSFGGRPRNRYLDCYQRCLTPMMCGFVILWVFNSQTPVSFDTNGEHSPFAPAIVLLPFAIPLLMFIKNSFVTMRNTARNSATQRRYQREAIQQERANSARSLEQRREQERQRENDRQNRKKLDETERQRKMKADKHARVLRQANIQVDLEYKKMESTLPARVTGSNFQAMKKEHLSQDHTAEELEANVEKLTQLLKQLHREYLLEEEARDFDAAKPADYNDMESAILFFKKREEQIKELPIDDDDKERLIWSLNEKREQVLDSYL